MSNPGYLSLTGDKQGHISAGAFTMESVNNLWQEGHEDEILVQAYSHHVGLPTDTQSGQPSGQRRHGKFTIVKLLDKSSPLLHNTLCSGEVCSDFTLKLMRINSSGQQEHYYTISLTDAIITDIQSDMVDRRTSADAPSEIVSFSYRAIHWQHEACGTSGSDDWRKPIV